MSDTPEGERYPLPVSAEPRATARLREPAPLKDPAPLRDSAPLKDSAPLRDSGRARDPGRPASRAEATGRASARHRIGIRELRQHASVYVDLAEKGYTVDITNRGRLVAQLVPVREPGSPLERLIAAGIIEPAEEPGGVGDIEPYPARGASSTPAASSATAGEIRGQRRPDAPWPDEVPGHGRPEGRQ